MDEPGTGPEHTDPEHTDPEHTDPEQTERWQPVAAQAWSDFFMVLRSVLAELPPGAQLLLRPQGDDRVAHVSARPRAHVEVRAGAEQLASLRCESLTDVIDHVQANVDVHWGLAHPTQLTFSYEGQVSPRLRSAFASDDLVGDLPDVDAPGDTAHSTGDAASQDLAGRLDAETLERLRRFADP